MTDNYIAQPGEIGQGRAMNWLTKLTPPGVKNIFTKKDSPDNLWIKCPKSGEMVFSADLASLKHVTPAGHHLRIGPDMRLGEV